MVVITVNSEAVVTVLTRVAGSLDRLVELVAQELAEAGAREAGPRSARLGEPWTVEGAGPAERHVEAPEWWAHFLAGGTSPHGPADAAERLVFEVNGETVWAQYVEGIAADHFDERAIASTRNKVDTILRQVIAEAGVTL